MTLPGADSSFLRRVRLAVSRPLARRRCRRPECPPVLFLNFRPASPRPEICEDDLWSGAANRTRKMTKTFNAAQVRAPSVVRRSSWRASSGVRSPMDSTGVPKPDLGDRSGAPQAPQPKCLRTGSVRPARSYRALPMPFVRFQPPARVSRALVVPVYTERSERALKEEGDDFAGPPARHKVSINFPRNSNKTNDRHPLSSTHFFVVRAPGSE
jgi:hypothetical protein